jgi:hypothetical protein
MFLNFNAEIIRHKEKIAFSQLVPAEKALVLKSIAEVIDVTSKIKCPSHKTSIVTITLAIAGTSVKVILDTCCTTMASIMEVGARHASLDCHIFSRNTCDLWKLN